MKFRHFLLALLLPGLLFAEELAGDSAHFQRFSALPVLGYSEVTGWEYGAMILLFTKPDVPGANSSSLDFSLFRTTKNQMKIDLSPNLYLLDGRFHLDVSFWYWDWASNYYGIGNNPDRGVYSAYEMKSYNLEIPMELKFLPLGLSRFLSYGPYFMFAHDRVSFDADSAAGMPEFLGGNRVGLGYQIVADSRTNKNWPLHGAYASFRQVLYSSAYGNDYDYFSQTIDLRAYTYLFWGTTLALGWYYDIRKGNVPFDALATLDGYKRFRGVSQGMFLDNQSISFQAELRKELFWRLGGTIFFEAGKVGPYFSKLMDNEWHYAPGFGGRLALNKSEKTNARCDFSLVDGRYLGMTIYIREAF
ncbi:MAG: hypothetical protein M0P13_08590 [Fibrobacteraceae bacterium]|nr:hypothetical protein [Fibrobacteraceae bacterium]